jgi:uncharacterized protein YlxP (DUF503 family)
MHVTPTHIMDKYINLANKLNKSENINNIWFYDKKNKSDIFLFFSFITNEEHFKKMELIHNQLAHIKKDLMFLKDDAFFTFEEKFLLFCIFIFKSLIKTTINPSSNDLKYLNSDYVINNITSYYQNFLIFYYNNEIDNQIDFKKIIFKIISQLVELGIVSQKIIRVDNKTLKEWSFEFSSIILSSEEYLNLSNSPYEILIINNNHYLKGRFFTKIYKIFEENIRSKEKFQFKSEKYLNEIIKSKYYLNYSDLNDVLNIIENKKNINKETIIDELNQINENMRINFNKIKKNILDLKKKYITISKNLIEKSYLEFSYNTYELDEFVLKIFLDFCSEILKKHQIFICEQQYTAFRLKLEKLLIDNIKKKKIKTLKQYEFEKILSTELFNLEDNEPSVHINEQDKFDEYDETINLNEDEINIKTSLNLLEDDHTELKSIIELLFYYSNNEIKKVIIDNKNYFINLIHNDNQTKKNKTKNLNLNAKKVYYFGLRFLASDIWYEYHQLKNKLNLNVIEDNKKNQARISELMTFYNMYLLKQLNWKDEEPVYFPFFFDFRGRFYYNSSVSPTTLKYVRYVFTYGYYTDSELNDNTLNAISHFISKHKSYIEIVKKKYNISKSSVKINESIFWTLISLGKIKIKKEKIKISIEEILDAAIDLLDNNQDLKIIDIIELMHYKKILLSLNLDRVPARGILKDATASFIQNLIRLMGYKDEESLKHANLNSTTHWYDTYSFILKKWIEREELKKKINICILALFIRFTVKKPVMTNPYSAAYITAFNYFKIAVKEHFNINIDFGSDEEIAFKSFYKFISTEVEDNFFLANNSKKIVNYIKETIKNNNKELVIESHDSKTNMIYYKLIVKNYDLIITIPNKQIKKRITKKYEEIDEFTVDYKKMARSIRANWVHYIDALLLRDINRNSKKNYITIHDCFIVDFLSVSEFIIIANEQSNIKIFENYNWNLKNNKEFFSLFIFI